jgi:rubrerythrin
VIVAHWTLDDIPWHTFDPLKVSLPILQSVRAASLVEANAADYVTYLCNIFPNRPDLHEVIRQWGFEEVQHGQALARWAEMAAPDFNFSRSLEHFRAGYSLPLNATTSVRGSGAGEMVARCIVEIGTSSFYSAIRDAAKEPVLKEICRRIAADEVRHYRLFRDCLEGFQGADKISLWGRLRVAWGRVAEAEDDELSYAYYSANLAFVPNAPAYNRKSNAQAYWARATSLYREAHIDAAVRMLFRAVELNPGGRLCSLCSALAWRFVSWRATRLSGHLKAAPGA